MRATFSMKTVRNKSDERCSAFGCVAIVTAPCIYIWRVLLEELLTKPLQTNWIELNIWKFRDRISPCTWCLLSASRLFHVSLNVFHYLLLFFPPRSFFSFWPSVAFCYVPTPLPSYMIYCTSEQWENSFLINLKNMLMLLWFCVWFISFGDFAHIGIAKMELKHCSMKCIEKL